MKSESIERVKIWIEGLKGELMTPLADISWTRMTTMDNLGFEKALQLARSGEGFEKAGERNPSWGRKWEYGWFYGRLDLADIPGACGQRIELIPDVGGEMLIGVNGRLAGSRDLKHDGITLTTSARGDETYEILIESYAGHGPRLERGGPAFYGQPTVPEPPACQVKEGRSYIAAFHEEAYGLYIDMVTLWQLYQCLDARSLRAVKILNALFEATRTADFELEPAARLESFSRARGLLADALGCVNGSTAPDFAIFGQSHLDLEWKWTWEETRRKCARTYSTQLALMDEYPDYIFFGCEPAIFESVKEDYPELFARIKEKVREGRIAADGGMYIESDCNIPEGEALIRQIMAAKEWYRDNFDCDTELLWLPDCFGFNGQLPQILKGCGIRYFSTQKLFRALSGAQVFPYNDFWWEGIDGSRILCHFYKKNNARFEVQQIYDRWYKDRVQDDLEEMIFPFGYGDGGGGATRDMLETAARVKDLEGLPRTHWESPLSFMHRLEERQVDNVYRGELYLAWHRGTYTSQSRIKYGNRRTESALREADLWCALAAYKGGTDRSGQLKAIWQRLMFLQFHDIIPGTSIERVSTEAAKELTELAERAEKLAGEARTELEAMDGLGPEALTVWNDLPWERSFGAGDLRVPACGYAVVSDLAGEGTDHNDPDCQNDSRMVSSLTCIEDNDGRIVMDNGIIRAVLDRAGRLCSCIYDGTEFMSGTGNVLHLYKDINIDYDAWEMASFYRSEEIMDAITDTRLTGWGIRQTALGREAYMTVETDLSGSKLQQSIVLEEGSGRIEFVTRADWHETHRLLRTEFPVRIISETYRAESAYGYVSRPSHRSTQADKDRFECCMHRYLALCEGGRGAALLNDSKYGGSADGNILSMSLLRAPKIPDMNADMGEHSFTYAFCPYTGAFEEGSVIRQGYELNQPLRLGADDNTCRSFETVFAAAKSGNQAASKSVKPADSKSGNQAASESVNPAASKSGKTEAASDMQSKSYLSAEGGSVIIDWVKSAEDGSGDLILRIYESAGCHCRFELKAGLPYKELWVCDMLENKEEKTEASMELGPFGIITLRMVRK